MIFFADESLDRQIINQHSKQLKQVFSVITPGSFRIRKINI